MKLSTRLAVCTLGLGFLLALGGRVARADDPPGGPPSGQGTASYHSAMRPQCEAEIKKDKDWYADLKEQVWALVQKDASHSATDNNRHVVIAYAVFWLLTVGFVLYLWRRQERLKGEIARLEHELTKATAEGGST